MRTDAELLREEFKLALEDPYYMETEVFGVGKGDDFPRAEEEIRPYLEWLNEPRDYVKFPPKARRLRYWSSPRFTAKSVAVAAWASGEIIKNPNLAIMVQSEQRQQAIKVVDMMRKFLTLPKVEQLFGRFRSDTKWAEDEFTVCQRTTIAKKDPTVQAFGMENPMQGWHPDIILWDDLLGETNNTRDGVAKVKARLAASMPVLRAGGTGIWICTRWGPEDPAAEILKRVEAGDWDAPGHRGFFGCYAVLGDEEFYPHAVAGMPLYPTILPNEEIERLRKEMPFELFASQILNDPIPAEGAYFRQSDFQYFPLYVADDSLGPTAGGSRLNPILDGCLCFMSVDPASGKELAERGDDHAITVAFIRWIKNTCQMYVVEEMGGQWKTDKLVDAIATLTEKWRPRKIFIETHTYQDWMMSPLKRRAEEFGVHYPIEEVKRGGRGSESKTDRILVLQTPYTYHLVWHAEHLQKGRTEEQLLRFRPNPKDHDDFRDSLATLYQEATRRKYGQGRREKGWKIGNISGPITYPRTGV